VPSLIDVTSAASRVYSKFYLPFEAFLFAAGIYLLATFMLVGVFRLAERHFLAYLAPQEA
jgi:arginine/ornithine transport system permease protein